MPTARPLALALLLACSTAQAVVIRHDVDDRRYRIEPAELPALADLPHEGHGVLIAPQWVLTVAHATQGHPLTEISINGQCRPVDRLVVHPGYRDLKHVPNLLHGDAAPLMRYMAGSADIALIRLKQPITDIAPIPLYRGHDERGQVATLYGKGASGNGRSGRAPDAPHRTVLRRADNTIDRVEPTWLSVDFSEGADALPLEGTHASGDSGGPVLMRDHGRAVLIGLNAREHVDGDVEAHRYAVYGVRTYQVRMSAYADWIDRVMAGQVPSSSSASSEAPVR